MCPFMGTQFRDETGAGSDVELDLIRRAFAEIHEGVIMHRPDGTLVLFNEACALQLGLAATEFEKLGPWEWSTVSREEREEHLSHIVEDGEYTFTVERRLPDGANIVLDIHSRLVHTSLGDLIVSVTHDVTEKTRAERMLRDLAFHDPLTGLANRTAFEERLESALSSAQRHADNVGLIYLDIDDFKSINDRYGHHVGDAVLTAVAHRLEGVVRSEDVVARLGGDEFVIIMPRLKRVEDAEKVADKIEVAIGKDLKISGGIGFKLHCAIGVTILDRDRDDAQSFVSRADLAMYESKKRGRRVPR